MTPPDTPATAEQAAEIARSLTKAQARNLLALPRQPGIWLTVAEMKGAGATGFGLTVLWTMHRGASLLDRSWTKWGGESGQTRGEGYEYSITPLGLAVRAALIKESRDA